VATLIATSTIYASTPMQGADGLRPRVRTSSELLGPGGTARERERRLAEQRAFIPLPLLVTVIAITTTDPHIGPRGTPATQRPGVPAGLH
jgi:hypothetical protein